jgi:hypothetical protein
MCVQTKAKQKASAFLRDDSDDEDSKKRIVKSHADKRYEELVEIVKALKNAMKVNDWNAIHDRDLPRHGGLVRARALIRNTTPSRALQERERSFATQHPAAHCKSAQPACASRTGQTMAVAMSRSLATCQPRRARRLSWQSLRR